MSSLGSIAELEAWLGRDLTDETAAQQALDIASGVVRTYCGHSISQILNDDIKLDGTGTNIVMLPAIPVNGIDLIEVNDEELEDTKYAWSKKGFVKRTDGILWPTLPNSIRIIYNHGFATIPDAILGVVLSLAGRIVDGSSGIKQETIGSYSVTYADPSPVLRANEQNALDAYKVTI
jgi:hypothetical protein